MTMCMVLVCVANNWELEILNINFSACHFQLKYQTLDMRLIESFASCCKYSSKNNFVGELHNRPHVESIFADSSKYQSGLKCHYISTIDRTKQHWEMFSSKMDHAYITFQRLHIPDSRDFFVPDNEKLNRNWSNLENAKLLSAATSDSSSSIISNWLLNE